MRNISFIREGSGKDLLFLHGYLSNKESFLRQIKYFSKFYRVTAFDFPGFGASEPIDYAYSVDDYADFTEQFMAEQGIRFPHVVAHSFGGRVALKCLSRGELFDRAVLCGCAGIVKRRTLGYRVKVGAYRAVKRVFPRFAERNFGSEEYRSLSPVMRESYKKIVNEDLRECAKQITRPVLFLNGELDGQTPLSSVKILHGCVRGSALKIIKNCGHFAQVDDALAFCMAVEEFLQ